MSRITALPSTDPRVVSMIEAIEESETKLMRQPGVFKTSVENFEESMYLSVMGPAIPAPSRLPLAFSAESPSVEEYSSLASSSVGAVQHQQHAVITAQDRHTSCVQAATEQARLEWTIHNAPLLANDAVSPSGYRSKPFRDEHRARVGLVSEPWQVHLVPCSGAVQVSVVNERGHAAAEGWSVDVLVNGHVLLSGLVTLDPLTRQPVVQARHMWPADKGWPPVLVVTAVCSRTRVDVVDVAAVAPDSAPSSRQISGARRATAASRAPAPAVCRPVQSATRQPMGPSRQTRTALGTRSAVGTAAKCKTRTGKT